MGISYLSFKYLGLGLKILVFPMWIPLFLHAQDVWVFDKKSVVKLSWGCRVLSCSDMRQISTVYVQMQI